MPQTWEGKEEREGGDGDGGLELAILYAVSSSASFSSLPPALSFCPPFSQLTQNPVYVYAFQRGPVRTGAAFSSRLRVIIAHCPTVTDGTAYFLPTLVMLIFLAVQLAPPYSLVTEIVPTSLLALTLPTTTLLTTRGGSASALRRSTLASLAQISLG
ncbi:hypothetical protein B0H12DRAFT_1243688 [Mycena haematopus]|nr:hypothetical protein B0H12DRAFT_1243688 [Mycena haematopus]